MCYIYYIKSTLNMKKIKPLDCKLYRKTYKFVSSDANSKG